MQQLNQNGLEMFIGNLNNLYIELLIEDAIRENQKKEYQQLIEESLIKRNEQDFLLYTTALKELEAM
ncbi:IDEAL domain protein [Macrococcus brunensis]|uniref:IDEAL domain protein n=1 Tax=Macrococcus brunensis TaxID=198483 RepID=A0A4R6BAZ0_9STAP|nr:IDEAL domain protein [Macrococcus brunensis]TDL94129.1 IDEAL domain protein [Macrococcus brunensis]ULG73733.1 IDEAL domain protein [Macrococcus brunensis]